MEDKLEKAFGDFIDRREYDEASNAMLALTRSAFIAGWKAAGGTILKSQPVFTIIEGNKEHKKKYLDHSRAVSRKEAALLFHAHFREARPGKEMQ